MLPTRSRDTVLYKGANFLLSPSLLNPAADLSYTHLLLQNEVPFESTLAYLSHARTTGATTVWNPSPMPSPEELKSVPWNSLDWLLVNEGEVNGLLNALAGPGRQANLEADETSAETRVRELHEHPNFSRSVGIVCTLGAKGVFALLPSTVDPEVVRLPAARLDGPVRDTTGAGDCFTGYFVAGLMQYQRDAEDVKRALRRAVEVRSSSLSSWSGTLTKESTVGLWPLRTMPRRDREHSARGGGGGPFDVVIMLALPPLAVFMIL